MRCLQLQNGSFPNSPLFSSPANLQSWVKSLVLQKRIHVHCVVTMQFKFAGVLLALGSSLRVATAIPASNIGLDTRSDALLDCLHSSLSSQATIETPGQPTFFNDTARFSTLYAPTFKAVSKVANEYDVAASVSSAPRDGPGTKLKTHRSSALQRPIQSFL